VSQHCMSTVYAPEIEARCGSRHCLSAMSALRSMSEAWREASWVSQHCVSTVCAPKIEAWCGLCHCVSAIPAFRSMNWAWLEAS
jgi:hypothetical protein